MPLTRRSALLAPLWLAACADEGPPRAFPPLRYDYLTPLRLNVAAIDYSPLPPPNPLDAISPAPAALALQQMAQDRLSAAGAGGRAVVTVEEARVARTPNGLDGAFGLRVDIFASDGSPTGFATARVTRSEANIGPDLRGALYDMTKQMLDDMNVELEFQLRRSLSDHLQATTTAPAPAPVEQQDL